MAEMKATEVMTSKGNNGTSLQPTRYICRLSRTEGTKHLIMKRIGQGGTSSLDSGRRRASEKGVEEEDIDVNAEYAGSSIDRKSCPCKSMSAAEYQFELRLIECQRKERAPPGP